MHFYGTAIIYTLAFLAAATTTSSISIDLIPATISTGPSNAQLSSLSSGFDAPKVHTLNSTAFDWWYFDVVSTTADSSVVIVFYTAASTGLWPGVQDVGSAVYASVSLSFSNGTQVSTGVVGTELVVVTNGDGSSGTLKGTGLSWLGAPDMSQYKLIVDTPDVGITGTISFTSVALAHFPCAPVGSPPGQPLNLGGPDLGWINALPDANAQVALTVGGTKLQFSGYGYHDKNWGPAPTHTVVKSWYWGHARLGPFSVVWFDVVAPDGTEQASSYVSRGGEVLAASCSGMTVRPTGGNDTWPPSPGEGEPGGFSVNAFIKGQGTLQMDVKHTYVLSNEPGVLWRWIGSVDGGFTGETKWTGSALYEQFTFW